MLASAPQVFGSGKDREYEEMEQERDRLYKKVGQLQVQVDFLKKHRTSGLSVAARRAMVEPDHPELSISSQCVLLELPRSSYYRTPQPETGENQLLMQWKSSLWFFEYCSTWLKSIIEGRLRNKMIQ